MREKCDLIKERERERENNEYEYLNKMEGKINDLMFVKMVV